LCFLISKEKLKEMVTFLVKKETIFSKLNENVFGFGLLLLKISSTPLLISGALALFMSGIKEGFGQQDTVQYLNNLQGASLP
jgi:hypothetical protein